MTLASIVTNISKSPLLAEISTRGSRFSGVSRIGKALLASAVAQLQGRSMAVVCASLEEAGRWLGLLEAVGWQKVYLYPTADDLEPETETIWGQMQVLLDLLAGQRVAVVSNDRALVPHLPDPRVFQEHCLTLTVGGEYPLAEIVQKLGAMGYERTALVEAEGQFSRRGDILDIFPVANELPVRIDWFGDRIEKIKEFDTASQRTLEAIEKLELTPAHFQGMALSANLSNYFPREFLVVIDEPEQCTAHNELFPAYRQAIPQPQIELVELGEPDRSIDLSGRAIPALPNQFGNLARSIREFRDQNYRITLVSAQPSRTVALLQEHDCPAQFVPNPLDITAIEKYHQSKIPVALRYTGTAELQGIVLPMFRQVIFTDREFFGQHALGTPSYVRKRRRAVAQSVDVQKLTPGDFVVHRHHGIGEFLKLEKLTINHETREYLVIRYADGLLRVAVDQMGCLSRYRSTSPEKPTLHKLASKAWTQTTNKARKAIKKLAFDLLELYAKRSQQVGYAFPPDTPWQWEMESAFPYQPTADQLKAIQDVKQDMESTRPMDRLVCGDVGFGKTEVAIRAIFKALMAGKQVAMLAPTTILAQQHYHTLKERFAPYPIKIALLNRFRSSAERKEIIKQLAVGAIDVVVGTHQLLGKEVQFKDLGLLVIDEEQRFGVAQKEKIKTLKTSVDVLTLTATPIPRTLYMAMSGVREMSLILTPPPSRRPIKTHLLRYSPDAVRTAIRQELERGGQVFYVVPRIEGIEETAAQIREMIPNVRLAIAHGQMPEAELESTMLAFHNQEADVLVCTTIVESGLDIPRVNTIIIEDAHRFGLAQLYQLRGRVGRSGIQAHAWLFYPEKDELTETARERLRAIQEFTQLGSGYLLATRDMEIRGVGNLLGAEQSGQMEAIGFELYMELLQEALQEIRGSEIPTVDDTQVDLPLTAFIPSEYISDEAQKLQAYRAVAQVTTKKELTQIFDEWSDRYGAVPIPAKQLLKVMELKLLGKQLGFSKVKLEGKQDVVLETKMAEPAWKKLLEGIPNHLQSRFVYQTGKVTIRGLGTLPAEKQLDTLITWLEMMNQQITTKI
ncbi:MAG: transcription-repair coupling factor [Pseudanabaenaceae cyanobacterium]